MTTPRDLVETILAALSLEERCRMLAGADLWTAPGCDRLGVPGWTTSDGPVGVRGRRRGPGTVFCGPSALGATWDPAVVEAVGVIMGEECHDKGIDLLLAPTVNLHRTPRHGRHFECLSEDPLLTARLGVAYIRGVQSTGVGACVKHLVANEQETDRTTIDTRVDERTLREVHLRPFEDAVAAGVRAIMGAYNDVNGAPACAHPGLQAVLRDDWGFDGLFVSDWGAIKAAVAPARHGLDVEMPGPGRWWGAGQLHDAVRRGDVDEELVAQKVRRVLRFLAWRGRLDPGAAPVASARPVERPVERPAHVVLARRAAADSMVLLRNEDGLLPLRPGATVALIGPGAVDLTAMGGGSAQLTPHRSPDLAGELGARLGDRLHGVVPGARVRRAAPVPPADWIGADGVVAELFAGPVAAGEPVVVQTLATPEADWLIGEPGWPEGVSELSVRLTFTLSPPSSGPHVVMVAASGVGALSLDGMPVLDTTDGTFPAGLAAHGRTATVDLEGGRPVRVEVTHTPRVDGRVVLLRVGIEPAPAAPERLRADAVAAAREADVAVVVVSTTEEWESEAADRESLSLPAEQDKLIRAVVAANPSTVVVLNVGAPHLLPWFEEVPAVLLAWYPGQEGDRALADVVLGDAEPGGRMPTTWARHECDTPAFLSFPGEEGVVRYDERLHVGHRWYDARGITPLIPFGHGLSYTAFEWGVPVVVDGAVELDITNVGDRPGSEVVQTYVAAVDPVVPRPPKVLAGFAKVHLAPGGRARVRVPIDSRATARWSTLDRAWLTDPGEYRVLVAASAVDVRGTISLDPAPCAHA